MWRLFKSRAKYIYLDHAAATPVSSRVFAAMEPYFSDMYGNPSSVHTYGQAANTALEEARQTIATLLSVRSDNVYFTGSGTESNNIALFGVCEPLCDAGKKVRIISTAAEHPSITRVLDALSDKGADVVYAPIDEQGRIDVAAFRELLTPETCMVSVGYANSETGVVQDIRELSRIIRAYNAVEDTKIVFHTDASQAPLWLPCEVERLGVDMLTLDAGKCYGPKGVGILVKRSHVVLHPHLFGGSQEQDIRPGTENVPSIVGASVALKEAVEGRGARTLKVAKMRDEALTALLTIPGVVQNGSQTHRLANNINISIPDIDSEYAVIVLDTNGIGCSTRSACSGQDGSGSAVVRAMTGDEARANTTLRITLGEDSTRAELQKMVKVLREHVEKTRTFQASLKTE